MSIVVIGAANRAAIDGTHGMWVNQSTARQWPRREILVGNQNQPANEITHKRLNCAK